MAIQTRHCHCTGVGRRILQVFELSWQQLKSVSVLSCPVSACPYGHPLVVLLLSSQMSRQVETHKRNAEDLARALEVRVGGGGSGMVCGNNVTTCKNMSQ